MEKSSNGQITHLSQKHGRLSLTSLDDLQQLQNLKIAIANSDKPPIDCYGKVTDLLPEQQSIEVQFTSIPPQVAEQFKQATSKG